MEGDPGHHHQAVLQDFIRQFGTTAFGSLARARLEELKNVKIAVVVPPSQRSFPCGGATDVSISARAAGPLSPAEECALKPKDIFKECDTCPEMVVIPPGSFRMGAWPEERDDRENPQHSVTIARPFAVGRFAVTFDEWDQCAADNWCSKVSDEGWGRGRRPVVNVSWGDAEHYAVWLSRKTVKNYRLLSEAEWEYAARAGTTTPYWWGSTITTKQANYDGPLKGAKNSKRTVPVDSFRPNPWGLYQVHGNVHEWVQDCAHNNYKDAPSDGSAWTFTDCTLRVMRNGTWWDAPESLRAAYRYWYFPNRGSNTNGFRVARTLMP